MIEGAGSASTGSASTGSASTGFESTGDPELDAALAQFVAAATAIGQFDLTRLVRLDGPSTGLHAAGRMVELARRASGAFDRNYVTALEAGDEPARHTCSSTSSASRWARRADGLR